MEGGERVLLFIFSTETLLTQGEGSVSRACLMGFSSSAREEHFLGHYFVPRAEQHMRSVAVVPGGAGN